MMACRKAARATVSVAGYDRIGEQLTTVETLEPESFSEFGSGALFTVAWFRILDSQGRPPECGRRR
jgi:hypothetical protein